LASIASNYEYAGDFAAASSAVQRAEKVLSALGDRQSLDYARLLKIKGNASRSHGAEGLAEAVVILTEAANLFATRYPKDKDHIGAFMFLAQAYAGLDQTANALRAADAAVAATNLAQNNLVEMANAYSLRASVFDRVGEYQKSLPDYDRASADYRKALGVEHFLYLQNENLRGATLQMLGQRAVGLKILESTAASIARVRQGSNTHINALRRLAIAYQRDGHSKRAAATLGEALAHANDHVTLLLRATLYLDQARAQMESGEVNLAAELVQTGIDLARAGNASTDMLAADAAVIRADIALTHMDPAIARQQIAEARKLTVGAGYSDTLRRVRLAILDSRSAMDLQQALQNANDAVRRAKALPKPANAFSQMAALRQQTAAACAAGDLTLARAAWATELTLRRQFQDPESPVLRETEKTAGSCRQANGR
jgi:tetratricopeptide (TPR) repeat protein